MHSSLSWAVCASFAIMCCTCGRQQQCQQTTCVVQYFELGFLYFLRYYVLASFLLCITVGSAFLSTARLYKRKMELFKSVDKQRLTPLVLDGRVRCDVAYPPYSPPHAL